MKEIGYINVHIDIETKKVYVSTVPYETEQDANSGIFIGSTIEKVGCFKIEYTKI